MTEVTGSAFDYGLIIAFTVFTVVSLLYSAVLASV